MDEGKALCPGNDVGGGGGSVDDHGVCAQRCYDTADCAAWMFNMENGNCWLKTTANCTQSNLKFMWGTKPCAGGHKNQHFIV